MQPNSITPVAEAFRLAVAGSPAACLEYPTPAVTGSLEALVVFMDRHRARVEAYAQLAGVPLATAADSIRAAAEKLAASRKHAAARWSELCRQVGGNMSTLHKAAQQDKLVADFAEAACLTPQEAAVDLTQIHLMRRYFSPTASHAAPQNTG